MDESSYLTVKSAPVVIIPSKIRSKMDLYFLKNVLIKYDKLLQLSTRQSF